MLVAWVLFPLVMVLVAGGLGLLTDRISGGRTPGVLILPLGLAGLIAVADLTTYWSVTAPRTTLIVVALAVVGFVVGRRRLRAITLGVPAIVAALALFAVYAAPVVLSGQATFAGYSVLGDTAIQFIGIDQLLAHGHTLSGLPPSSYRLALASYFDSGYPFGAQVGLGALRPLVGQDVSWLYQPYLAFVVVNLALALNGLVTDLVPAPRWRAALAFVAAQPALVYAYALQGSIKELATAALVPLLAALVLPLLRRRDKDSVAIVVPLAVASAAALAAVGVAAGVWLAPILLVALVALVRRSRSSARQVLGLVGGFVVVTALLSIPIIATLRGYLDVTAGVVTSGSELGNLIRRLNPVQVLGVWLNGDYRLDPASGAAKFATWLVVALAAACAVAGVVWMVRRRAAMPLVYVVVSAFACVVVVATGSPWAGGKALMIASPAALLAALIGVAALVATRRDSLGALPRRAGIASGVALAAGVLASNALAYHGASLAPRGRLQELATIGTRIDGKGPTLYTEFEEYGKHYLRQGDPEGVSEAFAPRAAQAARPGAPGPRFGFPQDLDDLSLAYVLSHRTIVLRRSPVASRPPDGYRLTWSGRWYTVWQHEPSAPRILVHDPLGSTSDAGAQPACRAVRSLALEARRADASLAYAEAPGTIGFDPVTAADRARAWLPDGQDPRVLDVSGQGSVQGSLTVPHAGTYALWLGGSFSAALSVTIDGRHVGDGQGLSGHGQYDEIAPRVALTAGTHTVRIVRTRNVLAPASGNGTNRWLGSLLAVDADTPVAESVHMAPPAAWRTLCGQTLDWIEVVQG